MLRLGEYDTRTLKVSTVRLGAGCVQACSHCGAYENSTAPGDFIVKEVTPARIAACLLQDVKEVLDSEDQQSLETAATITTPKVYPPDPQWRFMTHEDDTWHFEDLEGNVLDETTIRPALQTRRRLIDYFDSVVTTDINQEPLDGDVFLHFYRLVRLLSGGASRVPLITHGVRVRKDKADVGGWKPLKPKSEERLRVIVDAMDSKDIIVLSLDRARSWGNIPKELNMRSYAETLRIVKPALDKGVRVTVSVQGNDDSESRLSRVRAERLLTDLKELLVIEYGWTQLDLSKLFIDTGRNWALRGRAESMPGVRPENQCAVLPDAYWVARHMSSVHSRMGYVDAVSGKTFTHTHNKGRTYNDVAILTRWLYHADPTWPMDGWEEVRVNDGEPLPDLTMEFTPQARWAMHKTARAARAAARLPVLLTKVDGAQQSGSPGGGVSGQDPVDGQEELDAAMKVRAAGTSGDGDPGGCGT